MIQVTLPGGLWLGGVHHRQAELLPVAGVDEALLAEERTAPPARRVTRLLGRCVRRIGEVEPVGEETVRALTVGDREALLLHLRRLTLGEAMPCVLACPDCGEKLDLDLRVGDLLLPPYAETRPSWEMVVEGGDRVRFRLPTGADQEAAADCVEREGAEAAAALLLRRCVESGEDWPEAVAREVPARMAELDPQAEISLDLAGSLAGPSLPLERARDPGADASAAADVPGSAGGGPLWGDKRVSDYLLNLAQRGAGRLGEAPQPPFRPEFPVEPGGREEAVEVVEVPEAPVRGEAVARREVERRRTDTDGQGRTRDVQARRVPVVVGVPEVAKAAPRPPETPVAPVPVRRLEEPPPRVVEKVAAPPAPPVPPPVPAVAAPLAPRPVVQSAEPAVLETPKQRPVLPQPAPVLAEPPRVPISPKAVQKVEVIAHTEPSRPAEPPKPEPVRPAPPPREAPAARVVLAPPPPPEIPAVVEKPQPEAAPAAPPVEVRIGTIEIRAAALPPPPQQSLPAPARAASPEPVGFERYARVRGYAGWRGGR